MGLFFRTRGTGATQNVALFDIGSGSVGAAVASLSKTKLPQMVWTKRSPVTFQEPVDYDKLSKTMLSTLLDLALDLQSNGVPLLKKLDGSGRLDDVMFAFASPWYSTQAKVFKIEKDEPFEITQQFIQNLIKKEEKEFRQKSESSGEGEVPVLIERQVIQTALNGYVVSDPYHKQVKQAQIDLVLSAIPSYIYEKASDIRTQLVHSKKGGYFNSFILPAFVVTRDIFHNNSNFLLMDVSAEVTDLATIHKGTIIDATSFPFGRHTLVRHVASGLNTIPEEAASLLSGYMQGNLDESQTQAITEILKESRKQWLDLLTETLGQISKEAPLPRAVLLAAQNEFMPWFKRSISATDFSQYALSNASFEVTEINADVLSKHVAHSKLTSNLDPFLALETLYLQKVLYEQGTF